MFLFLTRGQQKCSISKNNLKLTQMHYTGFLMTWFGVHMWTTAWHHLKQTQLYSSALIKHQKKVQVERFNPCVADDINTNSLYRRVCWVIKAHCNGAITCRSYVIWGKNYIMLVSAGVLCKFIKNILRRSNKIQKTCVPAIFVGLKAVNRNKRWTELKKLRRWNFFPSWQTQGLKLE